MKPEQINGWTVSQRGDQFIVVNPKTGEQAYSNKNMENARAYARTNKPK